MDNAITELRRASGLSQKAFAEHFGIPVKTLQDWEQGRREPAPYVVRMIGLILKNETTK